MSVFSRFAPFYRQLDKISFCKYYEKIIFIKQAKEGIFMPQKPKNTFNDAASIDFSKRKAFFAHIRGGNAAPVRSALAAAPQAIRWQEPFMPEENPFSADDTPLMMAAKSKRGEVAQILLESGAAETIDQRNSRGWTALMYASWHGAADVADALLWRGADTWPQDANGYDAQTMAHMRGHEGIARSLQAHRDQVDGIAAFKNGLSKDVNVLRPPTVHKRGGGHNNGQ